MKPVSHTPTLIGLAHLVALLAVAMVIGGCSSVGDAIEGKGSIDYKSPGERPRLDVPPDLVTPKGDDRYSVPERQKRERTYSGFQSTRAADRAGGDARVLPSLQGMRIERAGSQRWLVVNQPADRLWPVIREFWQDSGFQIETESPATGIMQTGWAENRAKLPLDFIRRTLGKVLENLYSTGERDRFRTRLEKTSEGTEIYISHRGMIEVLTGAPPQESTVWQ
ncbi:MAG: outer membrane protein assembly factor BamC, partial [Quisquiliibacterium sp.]